MKLTAAQQQAVETTGTNILVSAGAGSGKTSVLSKRVIHELMEGASIDRFIILTFTNAAAAEMKQRIKNEIKAHPQLADQMPKLENAVISTFDAFALRLIRQYHYLLGLPKDIHVADDVIIAGVEQDIIETTLEPYYTHGDDAFIALLRRTFDRGDGTIRDGLMSLLNHLKMSSDPIRAVDEERTVDDDERIDRLQSWLNDILEDKRGDLCDIVDHVLGHLREVRDPAAQDYVSAIESAYAFLREDSLTQVLKTLSDFSHPRLPRSIDEQVKDYVKRYGSFLRETAYDFKDDINTFHLADPNAIREDVREQLPFIKTMLDLASDYLQNLRAHKKAHDLFEFSDIMNEAIRLLEQYPDIRQKLRDQTHEIMVDEYQDTNDLQNHMLGLLDRGNVFMVGDIKQSIYGFRNANPRYFSEKYKAYKKGHGGTAIDLTDNFRSRPPVLDFINRLFTAVMDKDIGGIDYDRNQRLVYGNKAYEQSDGPHPEPEVLVYDGDVSDDKSDGQREGTIIAADIRTKMTSACRVFDLADGRDRPLSYGDIAILYDRKTMFDDISKTLAAANIPVLKIDDEAFIESHEIVFVRQFLEVLKMLEGGLPLNAARKQSLYGLLRSFVYRVSDDAIVSFMLDHDTDDAVRMDDLTVFSGLYLDLHAVDPGFFEIPISEALYRLYEITDLYEAIASLDNPALCEKKLDFLIMRAKAMDDVSLDAFITYMGDVTESDRLDVSFTETAAMDDDRVKLMTMHKSKGLEFPVCYYGGLHKRFNYQKNRDFFVVHRDLGFFSKTMDDDGFRKNMCHFLLKEMDYREYLSERLRLFYVALTRAKERMIFLADDARRKESIAIENDKGTLLPALRFKIRDYLSLLNLSGVTEMYEHPAREDLVVVPGEEPSIGDDVRAASFTRFEYQSEPAGPSGFSKQRLMTDGPGPSEAMKAGEKLHERLEAFDFKAYVSGDLEPDPDMRAIVDGLLDHPVMDDITDARIFKEYEFYRDTDQGVKHGFIDFLAVWDDRAVIIDYKLSATDDEAYVRQLGGYREYVSSIVDVPVDTFLYSITTRTLKRIQTGSD